MDTELVKKITTILSGIPSHYGWDIEIMEIKPEVKGLYVRYKQKGAIQSLAKLIYYVKLVG